MSEDAAWYQVVVEGELDGRFARYFRGMAVHRDAGSTRLEGEVTDQAALQGLIDLVAELGLVLLSVNRLDSVPTPTRTGSKVGPDPPSDDQPPRQRSSR
jgi:hypothetical protein